jgi:hypothetical protein
MAQVFVLTLTPWGDATNDLFRAFSEDATC